MTIIAVRLAGALAAMLVSIAVPADPPRSDHPILGTWNITTPGTTCIETGTFEADGRYRSRSGQEIALSEYSISSEPTEKGFYKIVDVIVEDNGLPDCSGGITPVGDVATLYVHFGDLFSDFKMCRQETLSSCFGTARRSPIS
jgi:hypothetical protein